MTYAYATEWMTTKDREKFDRELLAEDPSTVSTGTKALAGLMGGFRRPTGPAGRES